MPSVHQSGESLWSVVIAPCRVNGACSTHRVRKLPSYTHQPETQDRDRALSIIISMQGYRVASDSDMQTCNSPLTVSLSPYSGPRLRAPYLFATNKQSPQKGSKFFPRRIAFVSLHSGRPNEHCTDDICTKVLSMLKRRPGAVKGL